MDPTLSFPGATSPSRVSSTVVSLNGQEDLEREPPVTQEATEGHEDLNSEFHREAYGPEPGEEGWDNFEVRFDPGDPENPYNWSRPQRWYLTALAGLLLLNA